MDPITSGMLISGGLQLAGGLLGKKSSGKGAKALAAAMRESTAFKKQMYETGRTDLAPYRDVGPGALDYLTTAAGEKSPLYDLQIEDSEKAINRYLASRGQYGSGAAGHLLSENARRVGAGEASARWGRNLSLADIGQRGAGFTADAGIRTADSVGRDLAQMGQGYAQQGVNLANIYGGTASGVNRAVQGGLQNYYFNQYLQGRGGGSGGGGGADLGVYPGYSLN